MKTTLLIATIVSCNGVGTPNTQDVVGEWERPVDSLPPINLVLTPEGSALRARLRLSGVERFGQATIDSEALRIRFDDGGALDGRFTSATELIVQFPSNGRSYRLRKLP
jgi:hypothetical protein